MTEYMLRGPIDEPVTLREMLEFCKADASIHARALKALRVSARLQVESITSLALMEQLWRFTSSEWPADGIFSTKTGPIMRVESARVFDVFGTPHEIEPHWFQTISPNKVHTIPRPPSGLTLRPRDGIEIDFLAGFGARRADVPVRLRQAILIHLGYRFEQTDAPSSDDSRSTPNIFYNILDNYRRK